MVIIIQLLLFIVIFSGFLWGLLISIMTVSWRYYLLFMTKNNDHCGCILPTNVVEIAICYIKIRFAQSTAQTLIGGEPKQR